MSNESNGSQVFKMHEGGPEISANPCIGEPPETVAIVGCGPTMKDWHMGHFGYACAFPPVDQVWGLNKGLRTQKADLGFVMDDLVGECRRSPEYYEDLKALKLPIITSTVDTEVRKLLPNANLTEYPLREVLLCVGHKVLAARNQRADDPVALEIGKEAGYYLHNSIPYMLAYALYCGVKGVQVFGCDYTYPGTDAREDDRANAEYWVGLLRGFGVEVKVPTTTTLLNSRKQPYLYGYGARPPVIQ